MSSSSTNEPKPVLGKVDIWPIVLADIDERITMGIEEYGTTLQSFNGRDSLWDAYQEALDLIVYLRQAIIERDSKLD